MKRSTLLSCLLVAVLAPVFPAAAESITFQGKVELPPGASATHFAVCLEHMEGRRETPPSTFLKVQPLAADGSFRLEAEKGEANYSLYIRDAQGRILHGYPHLSRNRTFPPIRLSLDGQVSGLILTPEGQPLKDTPVRLDRKLEADCTHFLETARMQTGADGAFLFDKLNPGEYQLAVESDAFAHPPHPIELSGDLSYTELRLKNAYAISGLVKTADGKPAAGVAVRADDKRPVITGADGRYRIAGLGPDSYRLTAISESLGMVGAESLAVKVADRDIAAPDVVVAPYGSIRLTLKTEPAGRPIPGKIDIVLQGKGRQGFYRHREAGVTNGVAVLGKVSPGRYQVALGDDLGGSKADATVESGKEAAIALVIPEVYSLGGRIVDSKGNGVAEASVGYMSTHNPSSVHRFFRADEDGRFSLDGIPPGEGTLTVNADNRVPYQETLAITASDTNRTITLSDGLVVTGRLVDASGAPVAGASIELQARQGDRAVHFFGSGSRKAESGADGSFAVSGITGGWYTVEVEAADHYGELPAVQVSPSNLTLGNLSLKKGLTIGGTVTEADGKGLAEAAVHISSFRSKRYVSKRVNTEEDGSFKAGGLPEGPYSVAVSDPETGAELVSLENVAAGTDDLIVSLAPEQVVAVRVTDPDGQPVEGAEIEVEKAGESTRFSSRSDEQKTGSNGKFEARLRQGDRYQVKASKPPLLQATRALDLRGTNAPPAEVVLKLEKGIAITGVVLDAAGQPKAGVYVSAAEMEPVVTDAKGAFALDGLAPGTATLTVHADEDREQALGTKRLLIKRDQTPADVRIELGRTGSVRGTVRNKKGTPLVNARIMMSSMDAMMGGSTGYQAETGSEGQFELEQVLPGKYILYCMVMNEESSGRPLMREVVVKAGETVNADLPVTQGSGIPITGRVVLDGKPLADANVFLTPLDKGNNPIEMAMGMFREPVKTGTNGIFQTEIPSNGVFQVSIHQSDPLAAMMGEEEMTPPAEGPKAKPIQYSTKMTIAPGQTNLVVEIRGGTLKGVVEGPDGKPVAGAILTFTPAGTDIGMQSLMGRHDRTGTNGQFDVRHLPMEPFTVKVTDEDMENIGQATLTPDTGTNFHRIRLSPGLCVKGSVKLADNGKEERMFVIVVSEQGEPLAGDDVKDGEYEISPRLPPGRYHLVCAHPAVTTEVVPIDLKQDLTHDFSLKPAGEINVELKGDAVAIAGKSLRITDASGRDIARLKPSQVPNMMEEFLGSAILSPTDEQGRVTVKGLAAGDYTITVEGTTASTKATVKPLETTDAVIPVK